MQENLQELSTEELEREERMLIRYMEYADRKEKEAEYAYMQAAARAEEVYAAYERVSAELGRRNNT